MPQTEQEPWPEPVDLGGYTPVLRGGQKRHSLLDLRRNLIHVDTSLLYHATPKKNAGNILKNGLVGNRLYFAVSPEAAEMFSLMAKGDYHKDTEWSILEIQYKEGFPYDLTMDLMFEPGEGWFSDKPITVPPNHIKVLSEYSPQTAEVYIMRKEPEPHIPTGFAYRIYTVDGKSMNIGTTSPEASEKMLRIFHPGAVIRREFEPQDISQEILTAVVHSGSGKPLFVSYPARFIETGAVGTEEDRAPTLIAPGLTIKKGLRKSIAEEEQAEDVYKERGEAAANSGDKVTAELYYEVGGDEHEHHEKFTNRLNEVSGGRVEYLPDSSEYMAQTIQDTGWGDRIDQAFQEAMKRVKR